MPRPATAVGGGTTHKVASESRSCCDVISVLICYTYSRFLGFRFCLVQAVLSYYFVD